MTKKQGRPRAAPKRVTVTLAQHHAEELQRLADEVGVTLSALCAHVLERYAIQDRELMTNDVLAQRLEAIQERYMREFSSRFGDVLLRQAHEIVALRRQMLAEAETEYGEEAAQQLKEASWQGAVRSLRPYTQKVRGEEHESQSASGEVHS